MILDKPELVMPKLMSGDEEVTGQVGGSLINIAKAIRPSTFSSQHVPNSDNATMIIFVYYKTVVGYFIYYPGNKCYFKTIEDISTIFTPNVLDLNTLMPLSTEDVTTRLEKFN